MNKYISLIFIIVLLTSCKSTPVYTPAKYMSHDDATLEQPAKPLMRILPKYPKQAEEEGAKGEVTAKVVIDETGSFQNIVIVKSMPEGVFDQVAIDALKRWKYFPAIYKGEKVKVNYEVTLNWGK